MRSLNKVELIGNLGSEPELRYTPGGKAVVQFSVATSRQYKTDNGPKEETEWHKVIAWDKLAETANQYLAKGSCAYVSGRIVYRKWTDSNGSTHNSTEIIADNIIFLSAKTKTADAGAGPAADGPESGPEPDDFTVVDTKQSAAADKTTKQLAGLGVDVVVTP